ncbi:MAG: uncharacterized membrane protein (UPF0127 family) [Haloarculaceae archaeon]|jgi:uncharacterized membrane protein (UPF0127 family)
MDERRVAAGVVVAIAAVAAAGLVVASGALAPLLAADGYQPVSSPTVTEDSDTPGAGPTPTEGDVTTETATPPSDGYERTTVTVVDENGTTLRSLQVAIADTPGKRYTGLSETEHLPEDRGMLFVHDSPGNQTYVMREMDFGLDIVFIGADQRIRRIHHAPEPPEGANGNQFTYPGYGQYVLEVNINWTARHNVSVGDRIEIDGSEG